MSKLVLVVLFTCLLLFPLASLQPAGDQLADRDAEPRGLYSYANKLYGYLTRFLYRFPFHFRHHW
nr:conotoxin [Conus monile]WFR85812.1 conotoxin [Conus araneosus]